MKYPVFLILFLFTAAIVFAQNPEALVQEMSGTVELKIPGSSAWKPAGQGDRLEGSTIISTGFKSTAVLAVGNSTLIVRPLTRLSLNELVTREGTETINVGLRSGRVQVNVKPPAGSRVDFTISSTVATASVRGTEFYMDPVNLRVIEGLVRFTPAGKPGSRAALVGAGQDSWLDTDTGKPLPPMLAADTSRSLPVLPGQAAAPADQGSGASQAATHGDLEMGDITLVPDSEK